MTACSWGFCVLHHGCDPLTANGKIFSFVAEPRATLLVTCACPTCHLCVPQESHSTITTVQLTKQLSAMRLLKRSRNGIASQEPRTATLKSSLGKVLLEVAESPFLEMFKKQVEVALCDMAEWHGSAWSKVGQMILEVFSNFNDSMILWLLTMNSLL